MSDKVFLDTNVLVYLYDSDAPQKQAAARSLLERAAEQSDLDLIISTQVFQEFYVTVTRKFIRTMSERDVLVAMNSLRALPTVQVDVTMIFEAIGLGRRFQISFWDALIVRAALKAAVLGCSLRNFQDRMMIGDVMVENPFSKLPTP